MTTYKVELEGIQRIRKDEKLQCCVCKEFFVMDSDLMLMGGWSCRPCTDEVSEESFLQFLASEEPDEN